MASRTVTLRKESGRLQFDCDTTLSLPVEWNDLLGRIVDLELHDFLVIGISENAMHGPELIEDGIQEC